MSDNQQKKPEKPELGLLEEDDEFEEFPAEGVLNFNVLIWCGHCGVTKNCDGLIRRVNGLTVYEHVYATSYLRPSVAQLGIVYRGIDPYGTGGHVPQYLWSGDVHGNVPPIFGGLFLKKQQQLLFVVF